jgi:hypothetical protein
MQGIYFSAGLALACALSTFFTIFCSSIRKARRILRGVGGRSDTRRVSLPTLHHAPPGADPGLRRRLRCAPGTHALAALGPAIRACDGLLTLTQARKLLRPVGLDLQKWGNGGFSQSHTPATSNVVSLPPPLERTSLWKGWAADVTARQRVQPRRTHTATAQRRRASDAPRTATDRSHTRRTSAPCRACPRTAPRACRPACALSAQCSTWCGRTCADGTSPAAPYRLHRRNGQRFSRGPHKQSTWYRSLQWLRSLCYEVPSSVAPRLWQTSGRCRHL